MLQRLEAATEDRRRGLEGAERIADLLKDAGAKYGDDYAMNKALRRRLRCACCVRSSLLLLVAADYATASFLGYGTPYTAGWCARSRPRRRLQLLHLICVTSTPNRLVSQACLAASHLHSGNAHGGSLKTTCACK